MSWPKNDCDAEIRDLNQKTIMLDGKPHVKVGEEADGTEYFQVAEDVRKIKKNKVKIPDKFFDR